MNKLCTYLVLCVISIASLNAQGVINTTEGKIIPFKSYTIENEFNELLYTSLNGKEKNYDLEDVFSLTIDGRDSIIYKVDSVSGNILTENEMSEYVLGAKSAQEKYKAPFYLVSGFVISAGALITLNLLDEETFWGPVAPACFLIGVNFNPVKDKTVAKYCPNSPGTYYSWGFKSVVRKKRFLNALLGAGAGLAFGVLTNGVINAVKN